jgi:hypothetical protein
METTYGIELDDAAVQKTLVKLTNQIYKLLPDREEGIDWIKPLETLIIELTGMSHVLVGRHDILFPLLCKLEGLYYLQSEDDFFNFRRTIFDCLNLMNGLIDTCH